MTRVKSTETAEAVDTLMATLNHPHKAAIGEFARSSAAPTVHCTGRQVERSELPHDRVLRNDHLRAKSGLAVILHLGAKARAEAKPDIKDPKKLLAWLAKDRAMVSFEDLKDLRAKARALQAVIRQWIRYVA